MMKSYGDKDVHLNFFGAFLTSQAKPFLYNPTATAQAQPP